MEIALFSWWYQVSCLRQLGDQHTHKQEHDQSEADEASTLKQVKSAQFKTPHLWQLYAGELEYVDCEEDEIGQWVTGKAECGKKWKDQKRLPVALSLLKRHHALHKLVK